MDWKEKYEALVGGIKGWLDKYVGDWQHGVYNLPFDKTGEIAKDLIKLVPKLEESEDEKIRKEIIDFINYYRHNTDLTSEQAGWCKKAIAYLEKHKEQGKCPEYCVKSHCIGCPIYENQKDNKFAPRVLPCSAVWFEDGEEKQKPVEWSEEEIVNWLKEHFYVSSFDNTKIVTKFSSMDDLIRSAREMLKSLCSQPHTVSIRNANKFAELEYKRGVKDGLNQHWKPTEEQIEALECAERWYSDNMGCNTTLYQLLCDLKRLKLKENNR